MKKISQISKKIFRSRLQGVFSRLEVQRELLFARFREKEYIFLIITSVLVGTLSALAAVGFRMMVFETSSFLSAIPEVAKERHQVFKILAMILIPALGGLLVGILVTKVSKEIKGSGIPEVMDAVARKGGVIKKRILFLKALAATLTIGSGGSAGREGPIVQIGGTIGSAVGQFFEVSVKNLRTLVACGVAAGIAATFNAPIAGALFAMEVVLGEMGLVSMSPIVISSVVATVISRYFLGDYPAFMAPPFDIVSYKELFLHALLGILAGLIAVFLIKSVAFFSIKFEKIKMAEILKPALGGLCVGFISLGFPHVLGVGYDTINSTLTGEIVQVFGLGMGFSLLLLLFVKIMATSLTIGSGGVGGLFAPSLFIGSAMGAAMGFFANIFFPGQIAPPPAYALVGMGALISASTHAPISAILIIFELTNNYVIIPPLMLSCVIAVLLSSYLNKYSIYTDKLARQGIKLTRTREVNLLKGITVSEFMDESPQIVPHDMPAEQLFSLLLEGKKTIAIVVDESNYYIGTVELSDVRDVVRESKDLCFVALAADMADRSVPVVTPDIKLDRVMHLLGNVHKDELAVCVDFSEKKVIGAINKKAVIEAYNSCLIKAELSYGLDAYVDLAKEGRTFKISKGVYLYQAEVPHRWVGKKLKDLDVRRKQKLEIILVQRMENNVENEIFPDADFIFNSGDKILVLGKTDSVDSVI